MRSTKRARVIAGTSALAFMIGQAVFAAPVLAEGCLPSSARLSEAAVKTFKDQPADLVARHAAGGPPMSAELRRLAGSDVSTVPSIIALARGASTAQIVAIGAGLANAAHTCSRTRPDLERRIKQEVADAGILELSIAFAAGVSSWSVARPMGPDPTPVVTAAPIDNLQFFGLLPAARTAAPGGPAPTESSPLMGPSLTFGNGGVRYTFGGSVSPSR